MHPGWTVTEHPVRTVAERREPGVKRCARSILEKQQVASLVTFTRKLIVQLLAPELSALALEQVLAGPA